MSWSTVFRTSYPRATFTITTDDIESDPETMRIIREIVHKQIRDASKPKKNQS